MLFLEGSLDWGPYDRAIVRMCSTGCVETCIAKAVNTYVSEGRREMLESRPDIDSWMLNLISILW